MGRARTASTITASPSASGASRSLSPSTAPSLPRASSSALEVEGNGESSSGGLNEALQADKPPKKRKPKGWRGWAMEVEDEQGNWVTVAPGSDPNDPIPRPSSAQETRAERQHTVDGSRRSEGPAETRLKRQNQSASPYYRSIPLPTVSTQRRGKHKDLPPPAKRPRKNSAVHRNPVGRPRKDGSSSRGPSAVATPQPRGTSRGRDALDLSTSRKADLDLSMPASNTTSTSGYKPTGRPRGRPPKASLALGETPPAPPPDPARPAAAPVRPREQSIHTASPALARDNPLPAVIRAGMGDNQPTPAESNIRSEGLRLIQLAKSYRSEADSKYGQRDPSPESEPLLGLAPSPPAGRAVSLVPSSVGESSRVHIRANGLIARQNGSHLSAMPITRDSTRSLTPPPPEEVQPPQDTFDQDWAKISAVYQRSAEDYQKRFSAAIEAAAMPQRQVVRPWDDPGESKPPVFPPGLPATVVLDGNTQSAPRPSDRLERYELEGLNTLPEPFRLEAEKFADHVKNNLRSFVGYWFPQASVYRNAYLEEVGRRLSAYGLQLTTDADAAMENIYPVNMVNMRVHAGENDEHIARYSEATPLV